MYFFRAKQRRLLHVNGRIFRFDKLNAETYALLESLYKKKRTKLLYRKQSKKHVRHAYFVAAKNIQRGQTSLGYAEWRRSWVAFLSLRESFPRKGWRNVDYLRRSLFITQCNKERTRVVSKRSLWESETRSNRVQHRRTETGPVRMRLHHETASFRNPLKDLSVVVAETVNTLWQFIRAIAFLS